MWREFSRAISSGWLVVWNIFYFPIDWEYSSQLTNIFQRGGLTTNQQAIGSDAHLAGVDVPSGGHRNDRNDRNWCWFGHPEAILRDDVVEAPIRWAAETDHLEPGEEWRQRILWETHEICRDLGRLSWQFERNSPGSTVSQQVSARRR